MENLKEQMLKGKVCPFELQSIVGRLEKDCAELQELAEKLRLKYRAKSE